jgi:hypothetical protein
MHLQATKRQKNELTKMEVRLVPETKSPHGLPGTVRTWYSLLTASPDKSGLLVICSDGIGKTDIKTFVYF